MEEGRECVVECGDEVWIDLLTVSRDSTTTRVHSRKHGVRRSGCALVRVSCMRLGRVAVVLEPVVHGVENSVRGVENSVHGFESSVLDLVVVLCSL